jgi:hypothetical protein
MMIANYLDSHAQTMVSVLMGLTIIPAAAYHLGKEETVQKNSILVPCTPHVKIMQPVLGTN